MGDEEWKQINASSDSEWHCPCCDIKPPIQHFKEQHERLLGVRHRSTVLAALSNETSGSCFISAVAF
jgi:hypothetical protein